jgi:CRISPR/Cas system CSM-associated protein Csm3 (group 7 of RAMP superfamily)
MKNLSNLSIFAFFCAVISFSSCTDTRVDLREPFLGHWNVHEVCNTGNFDYTINIRALSAASTVEIDEVSFYNLPFQPEAIISGSRIDIPTQKYYVRTNPELSYEFTGTGLLNGNTLTIDYDVYKNEQLVTGMDTRLIDQCTMNCTK